MEDSLRVESPARIYGVDTPPPILHTENINGLRFSEVFEKRDDIDEPLYLGEYKVLIEGKVSNFDNLNVVGNLIKEYTELLDKLWIYVTAFPITVTDFSKFRLELVQPISKGWTSNYEEVEAFFAEKEKRLLGRFSFGSGKSWMVFKTLPLQSACMALERYRELDEPTTYLIDLHHLYLTSGHISHPIFLLAKALELVESMIEGKTRKEKSRNIEKILERELPQSFAELLRIANTSWEIRHVVREKKLEPVLHQSLDPSEISEFATNANAIVRGVVCNRLDLPLVFIER